MKKMKLVYREVYLEAVYQLGGALYSQITIECEKELRDWHESIYAGATPMIDDLIELL